MRIYIEIEVASAYPFTMGAIESALQRIAIGTKVVALSTLPGSSK